MHEDFSVTNLDLLNTDQIERSIERALKMVEVYRRLNEQASALKSNLKILGDSVTTPNTEAQQPVEKRRLYKDIRNFFLANPTRQVTATDIAKAIGYAHKPSIRAYLSKFIKRGYVIRVSRNLYQAADA